MKFCTETTNKFAKKLGFYETQFRRSDRFRKTINDEISFQKANDFQNKLKKALFRVPFSIAE